MKYALMTMIFALKIYIIHTGQSDLLRLHRMFISVKSVGLLSVQVQTLQTTGQKNSLRLQSKKISTRTPSIYSSETHAPFHPYPVQRVN